MTTLKLDNDLVLSYPANSNLNVFVYNKPYFIRKSQPKPAAAPAPSQPASAEGSNPLFDANEGSAPPEPAAKPAPQNDFEDLWIKKYFFITSHVFPGIYRSSEVVKRAEINTPPIDNAISTVSSKTDEIDTMLNKHLSGEKINVNGLTSSLNGVLDPAVNGGVGNYQSAFLDGKFEKANPGEKYKVEELRAELSRQVEVLERGVDVHAVLVSDEMRKLHDHMVTQLGVLKSKMAVIMAKS
eukprot:TRINITY_DN3378_c0_g1_i1.p1 TRINITY_DN3378_c0_g1~~TRINITY_DN3378_c0_g1_i1.p1  ORF type:complete len:240 (-),score=64.39 TRINITY_DN3378_c0_g1_i1:70-789(-)